MDNGWENILLHEVDPNIKLYHSNPGKPNQKALVERMIRDLILDSDLSNSVCFDHLDEANIKAIIESDCFCKIVDELTLNPEFDQLILIACK